MRGLSKSMIIVCLTAATNCAAIGYDSAMMSSLNIMAQFKTEFNVTSSLEGLITALANIGGIIGGLFAGPVVNRIGRKGGILTSAIIGLIACLIMSTSTTQAQFLVGRVVAGISKAFDIASVPPYLVEVAPPKHRGFVSGFYWTCWLLGSMCSAGVGQGARTIEGSWSWRTVCICMSAPALLSILLLPFIPESPRWLVSKGRNDEGARVLADMHGGGDLAHALVVAEYGEITTQLAFEASHRYATWAAWWQDLVGSASNVRRLVTLVSLGVFEQTIGSSIVTFYIDSVLELVGVTDQATKFKVNLGQSCFAFASALAGICFIDRLGRVRMLVFGTAFCACVLATMAGLTATVDGGVGRQYGIVAMAFVFQFGYSSTWTPLSFAYCAEILNFTIRARGMAYYGIITSLVGFVNQYLIPIGMENIGWRFYIVGLCWNVAVATFIAFYYRETKGLTLEQIDRLFQGVPRSELSDVLEVYEGVEADKQQDESASGSKSVAVKDTAVEIK